MDINIAMKSNGFNGKLQLTAILTAITMAAIFVLSFMSDQYYLNQNFF